jgi:chromate transporter
VTTVTAGAVAADRTSPPGRLPSLALYFLKLGTIGFGGPIALAGRMQRDLVDQRGWISVQDYKEGLALAQLAPGPLAAQLAMYIGWVEGRTLGATLVALAFVGPSFLMVLGLSFIYVRFGGLPWIQAAFYGVGAAVIAVMVQSVLKLLRTTLAKDRTLWLLFAVSLVVTAGTEREMAWLFIASGLIPVVTRFKRPLPGSAQILFVAPWSIPLVGTATAPLLVTVLGYFMGASLFVFGSGLAIVPFLHGGVVLQHHWLTERQFLDAVAISMITPGPVVITVAFIGYLVAGPLGAFAAAIGVFLPPLLVVVLAAPHFRRLSAKARVRAFVDGVTAAATGAIAGAVIVLGRRALVDWPAVVIGSATLTLMLGSRRIPEPVLMVGAALIGILLR